jgi:hypothetical protein
MVSKICCGAEKTAVFWVFSAAGILTAAGGVDYGYALLG